jgi:FAD/FMN-containing dehydrogenase
MVELSHQPATLTVEAASELRTQMTGPVSLPGDAIYETRRKLWNGLVDKFPAVIAQCANEADIAHAIAFARQHGLPLAVRGGGHHSAGFASVDDGLVIDLSLQQGISVDPITRTATAQPGALACQMYEHTEKFGLVLPKGMEPTVGLAGLTLGGGEGWLTSKFGLTCDNLVAANVVTAEGRIIRASLDENADLLWGLRGGGGNFGVVSSFEYRLHEVRDLIACRFVYAAADAPAVLRRWRDIMDRAPPELASLVMVANGAAPILIIGLCWLGFPDDLDEWIAPLRNHEKPLSELVCTTVPSGIYHSIFGAGERPKLANYVRTQYMRELSDEAIDIVVEHGKRIIPSPTVAWLTRYHGAFCRVPEGGSAYPHRDTSYQLGISTQWPVDQSSEPHIAWARALWQEMVPFASGRFYVNYSSDPAADMPQSAYGANWQRLREIKRKYDPHNVFRGNFNIPPAD